MHDLHWSHGNVNFLHLDVYARTVKYCTAGAALYEVLYITPHSWPYNFFGNPA
jgi:hypothetical protein